MTPTEVGKWGQEVAGELGFGWVKSRIKFLVVQCVKDPVLSLQQLVPLLWPGLDPWPRNFHVLWVWPKKVVTRMLVDGQVGLVVSWIFRSGAQNKDLGWRCRFERPHVVESR